jgi:hypothetical protein
MAGSAGMGRPEPGYRGSSSATSLVSGQPAKDVLNVRAGVMTGIDYPLWRCPVNVSTWARMQHTSTANRIASQDSGA